MRADHLQRLERCVRLVSSEPLRDKPALQKHAEQLEVLITSWGAPRIDTEIVDCLPRLKLIAHMAGSVKGFIDDVVWRRRGRFRQGPRACRPHARTS